MRLGTLFFIIRSRLMLGKMAILFALACIASTRVTTADTENGRLIAVAMKAPKVLPAYLQIYNLWTKPNLLMRDSCMKLIKIAIQMLRAVSQEHLVGSQ